MKYNHNKGSFWDINIVLPVSKQTGQNFSIKSVLNTDFLILHPLVCNNICMRETQFDLMNSKQPFAEGIDSQWEVVWSSYIKMDLCVHLDANLSMSQKELFTQLYQDILYGVSKEV